MSATTGLTENRPSRLPNDALIKPLSLEQGKPQGHMERHRALRRRVSLAKALGSKDTMATVLVLKKNEKYIFSNQNYKL
jgi:hypothetical protein